MFVWYIFFFVVAWFIYKSQQSKSNFPPGPPKLPFIGSILSVLWANASDPSKAFDKLSKKYGPIVGLKMGSVSMVAICGNEKLKQIANSEDLLTRIDENDLWLLEKTNSVPLGIIFSLPELWMKTRAYTVKTLKKYDLLGLTKTNGFVLDEILEMCDEIRSQMTNGQVTLSLHHQFSKLFFNIVWMFLTGKKYGTKESRQAMMKSINEYIRYSKFTGSIVQIYPWLVPKLPGLTGFKALKQRCEKWRQNIRTVIAAARTEGGYLSNPENYLEEFLQKADTNIIPKNLQDSIFTEENVVAVFEDIPMAGTDTQSIATVLFIRFLLENPHVQVKLQEEVDRVIGNTRLVSVDDLPSLNYMQATVAETIRIGNVAPVIPRKMLKDWNVDGYMIPKGTLVILNMWSGDHDEKVYKDPEIFQPERFLSADGKHQNAEKLMAFGFGKRRCIAEQYARVWIPLLCTTLIQNFSFHVDPKFGTKWGPEGIGLTRSPAPFNVIVRSRGNTA